MKESPDKYMIYNIRPVVGNLKPFHRNILGLSVQTRLLEKGQPWVAYAEDYGAFHTSTVVDIVDNGDDLCIETANTKYFLKKL